MNELKTINKYLIIMQTHNNKNNNKESTRYF